MVKRVYATPKILKVQLSHEQAVLAVCSTRATSTAFGLTGACTKNTSFCRRTGSGAQGQDSGSTS
jgi:hypothetical protein